MNLATMPSDVALMVRELRQRRTGSLLAELGRCIRDEGEDVLRDAATVAELDARGADLSMFAAGYIERCRAVIREGAHGVDQTFDVSALPSEVAPALSPTTPVTTAMIVAPAPLPMPKASPLPAVPSPALVPATSAAPPSTQRADPTGAMTAREPAPSSGAGVGPTVQLATLRVVRTRLSVICEGREWSLREMRESLALLRRLQCQQKIA